MTERDVASLLPLPYLNHLVLLALAESDAHGWALIKRIRALSGGLSSPSSGSMYLALARLESRGLVEGIASPESEGMDGRRQYYRLTPFGARALAAETVRLESLVKRARRLRVGKEALDHGRS